MAGKIIDRTLSAYEYPLLIKRLLQTPLIYSPQQEIVYRDVRRYDYVTFSQRIGRLANALRSVGVQPGHTVAVMDWDSHRYLECFFAVTMMGAILHTINVRLSPEQILYTIKHAEDDVILVNSDFLPVLEGLKAAIQRVRGFVLLNDRDEVPQSSLDLAGEYEDLLGQSSSAYDFPDLDENTRATIFYTTGTTGPPKGVYFSHRQLVLHTFGALTALSGYKSQGGFNSGDVYMPLTPMFHVHAWGLPYVATLLGAKQVYPGRYEPDTIFRLIQEEKVTFSHCVPTILHMLLSSPAVKKVDLSHWKVIIGGSALPKSLCRAAMDLGINVFTGYGMSETCPILTLANLKPRMLDWDLDRQVAIRCKTGLPMPLVDLKVVDPNHKDLPRDGTSTGEVVVRTPWLTQGYFKESERSEELWTNGWLHTGDIGCIDGEGYLQVTDRIKDVIKTGGEWISSLQLEDIITQHPAVSEAAVLGVPDEKWGDRPLALVVLKQGEEKKVSTEDIRIFFRDFVEKGVVSKWGVPDRIVFVKALAKTSVGKLDKRTMRGQYR
jgi:fatty-acyl-CoA synthase